MPEPSSSEAPRITAPAPSPKITETSRPRVERSRPVEWTSEPTNSTFRYIPERIQASANLEPVDEPAALVANVEGRRPADLQQVVQQAPRAREVVVGRERREDDGVEILGLEPRHLEGVLGGAMAEIGRAGLLGDPTPLLDPGPLLDPVVAGVHPSFEIGVGHHPLGDVVTSAEDLRPHHSGARLTAAPRKRNVVERLAMERFSG